MKYDIEFTQAATADLQDILDYITDELANPSAASGLIDAVNDCLLLLQDEPLAYPACLADDLSARGYRKAVVKNYILLYKVNRAESLIIVYRIVYGRRDYGSLL